MWEGKLSDVCDIPLPDPSPALEPPARLITVVVNQMVLEQGDFYPPNQYPTPAPRHAETCSPRANGCGSPPQRREATEAGRQDRSLHARRGRHHHRSTRSDQRGVAAQQVPGAGRIADGPHHVRNRDRLRARCASGRGKLLDGDLNNLRRSSRTRATTSRRSEDPAEPVSLTND